MDNEKCKACGSHNVFSGTLRTENGEDVEVRIDTDGGYGGRPWIKHITAKVCADCGEVRLFS